MQTFYILWSAYIIDSGDHAFEDLVLEWPKDDCLVFDGETDISRAVPKHPRSDRINASYRNHKPMATSACKKYSTMVQKIRFHKTKPNQHLKKAEWARLCFDMSCMLGVALIGRRNLGLVLTCTCPPPPRQASLPTSPSSVGRSAQDEAAASSPVQDGRTCVCVRDVLLFENQREDDNVMSSGIANGMGTQTTALQSVNVQRLHSAQASEGVLLASTPTGVRMVNTVYSSKQNMEVKHSILQLKI